MAEPLCPYLGYVATGFLESNSFAQSMSGISPGSHSVQTFVYTDSAATRSIYTIIYRVYRP